METSITEPCPAGEVIELCAGKIGEEKMELRRPTEIEIGHRIWDVYENVPSGYVVIRLHDLYGDDDERFLPHDGASFICSYESWADALAYKNKFEQD